MTWHLCPLMVCVSKLQCRNERDREALEIREVEEEEKGFQSAGVL